MSDSDSDDDVPQLSSHALAALQEFYKEQQERTEKIAALTHGGGAQHRDGQDPQGQQPSSVPVEIDLFQESWQLSQFWYDSATIETLAAVIVDAAGPNGNIALVSTPSLYKRVKELATAASSQGRIALLEFDKRFCVYPDFVFYDYNHPLEFQVNALPADLPSRFFDIVVADPPFLAEECLAKTSETVRHLAKDKVLLCSGLVMRAHAARLLDLRLCTFRPTHSGGRLSNEFACFANFPSELGWDTQTKEDGN